MEIRPVTPAYLEFLREQIELNARGPKWSNILAHRLESLEHHKNEDLIVVHEWVDARHFFARVHPLSYTVVHGEVT